MATAVAWACSARPSTTGRRLEAACTLALELRAGHYRHVRDILANGRDLVPRSEPAPEWVAPVHDNVRGAANYH